MWGIALKLKLKRKEGGEEYKGNISIKWRLAAYLALFTAVLIAVLWLLQIVFLNDFYR